MCGYKKVLRTELASTEAGRFCFYCGVEFSNRPWILTLEHFVPVSQGGRTERSNCGIACRRCNARRGTRDLSTVVVCIRRGLGVLREKDMIDRELVTTDRLNNVGIGVE